MLVRQWLWLLSWCGVLMDCAAFEGFALTCDDQGNILHIVFDSIGFFVPKPEHVNFIELTGGQGCERLQAFFRELRERGAALCWGVELPFGAGSEVLNFFGLAREGNVSLVSSRDPKELFALHNKLQGTTHEIPFILQPLHQKALASVHNQPPGNWAFDEFMNLNNELINAKRELSKNEHKLKQQASHEREVLFESLFEHSPVGLAIVGLDFLIQRANSEFCRITGYTRQELERLEFSALAHNDDLLTDIEHTRQLEVGLIDQYTKDKRYLAKGGDITWVHVSLRLIRDDTGRPQYYLPMILDAGSTSKCNTRCLTVSVFQKGCIGGFEPQALSWPPV